MEAVDQTIPGHNDDFKEKKYDAPPANDFAAYLPYACDFMDITTPVEIMKATAPAVETPSDKRARSTRASATRTAYTDSNITLSANTELANLHPIVETAIVNRVKVLCIYDKQNKLTGLEITNCTLPRDVIKVMTLILVHQPQLQSLIIKARIDVYTIPEVLKIQKTCRLTEVCFDGTYVKEANYQILLNDESFIRHLSLSRCKINDEALKTITDKLPYPQHTSKTLQVLNLSSNRITNKGCRYLADALRTNRCLRYINLADNQISDDGAEAILSMLLSYPLTFDEVIEKKKRRYKYYQKKLADLKTAPKENIERRHSKTPSVEKKRKASIKPELDTKEPQQEEIYIDPYDIENTEVIDNVYYSKGNYILTYLNFAYNSLGYFSVVKLLKVLEYQRTLTTKDKGLVRVVLNGNPIPRQSPEMIEVDHILNVIMGTYRKQSSFKATKNTMNSLKSKMNNN